MLMHELQKTLARAANTFFPSAYTFAIVIAVMDEHRPFRLDKPLSSTVTTAWKLDEPMSSTVTTAWQL